MDLNHRIYLKKCRVCNKDGSRNIFEKLSRTLETPQSVSSVASVDRLLEKLRYVTLNKIDEFDNKPKMLCDLCIIQLNVAYQFKTLAIETDAKHQQYLIENGVNLSPNSDSTLQCIEQRTLERSLTTIHPRTFPMNLSNLQHRRLIKSEPTDYENMSDITIDTNTDLIEDFSRNGSRNDVNSASNQPFGSSNMVCVSDLDLLRSSNGDSDIEFINNCLPSLAFRHFEHPPNTVESHQSTTTTTTTTIASQLVIAASKTTNNNSNSKSKHKPHESSDLGSSIAGSEVSDVLPKKNVKSKKSTANVELKKSLRPKSNNNVNYSLVKRYKKHKLINPVNKVRQMIKEEKESIKQSPSKSSHVETVNSVRKVNPKHSPILKGKHQKNITQGKNYVHFPRGQSSSNKGQCCGKLNIRDVRRRITIKDTDRFKFASIETINSDSRTRD